MPRSGEVDVVIVGAGAAGVAAARRLWEMRPDQSLIILEASNRVGGRARTVLAAPDLPVDLGCGWLHGAKDNAWARIAERSGFAIDHALSSWDGASRDLGLGPADDKAAREALAAFFERADGRGGQDADVPFSAMLDPDSRWNGLLGAIGTFINGAELELASLRDYQRYEPGRGPDTRVVDGYGRLVESYAAPLQIAFGMEVQAIDHAAKRLRVETDRGTFSARAVLVTASTAVLAREAIRFTPALPAKIEAAAQLPLGLANKLFLALPDALLAPESHVIGSAERTRTAGYHVRPFGRPVIECYFGGALAEDLEQDGVAAAVAFAQQELAAHLGAATARGCRPLATSAWRSEPLIGGSYSYARPGAWDQRAVLAASVDERLFFAGEACSPHRFSTAHGAYETGVAAADAIAAALPQV